MGFLAAQGLLQAISASCTTVGTWNGDGAGTVSLSGVCRYIRVANRPITPVRQHTVLGRLSVAHDVHIAGSGRLKDQGPSIFTFAELSTFCCLLGNRSDTKLLAAATLASAAAPRHPLTQNARCRRFSIPARLGRAKWALARGSSVGWLLRHPALARPLQGGLTAAAPVLPISELTILRSMSPGFAVHRVCHGPQALLPSTTWRAEVPLARAEAGDAIVLPLSPFAPLAVDRHAVELALLRARQLVRASALLHHLPATHLLLLTAVDPVAVQVASNNPRSLGRPHDCQRSGNEEDLLPSGAT
mmetsp:Transcript_54775/g.130855  ORF Transcript_54775/g.130855 Transcript_54775/m.130855 type:complete len:302 (-) Transcript_54775:58-963(-)